ncbi:MAG: RHS repeat-associated core domain-containing protein, partial [Planctomycetota bacterium]|nr:RHS repeat-associated core domain-containing protein [Planctomycetota bacterium]
DAFGNALFTGAAATTLLYSGEQYDSGLKEYCLRARYYDQAIGRFSSFDFGSDGDTSDPQSLHKYLYASADPVNSIDRSGHFTEVGLLKVSGIIALLITCVMKAVWDSVVNTQAAYNAPYWQDRYRYSVAASGEVLGVVTSLFGNGSIDSGSSYALVGSGPTVQAVVVTPRVVAPGVYVPEFVVYKGGIGPVNQGKAGAQLSHEQGEARGAKVSGDEVTIRTKNGYTIRFDKVVREKDNSLVFIEAKNGATAELTSNQKEGFLDFVRHGGTPVGKNADQAQVGRGKFVQPGKFIIRVDYWNTGTGNQTNIVEP